MTKSNLLGISLSTLCIIHCLLTPVLSSLFLLWGISFGSHEFFHRFMLVVLALIGLLTFIPSIFISKHRFRYLPIIPAALGMAAIGHGALVESLHRYETILTLFGSFMLITAHIGNHLILKVKECCEHD